MSSGRTSATSTSREAVREYQQHERRFGRTGELRDQDGLAVVDAFFGRQWSGRTVLKIVTTMSLYHDRGVVFADLQTPFGG